MAQKLFDIKISALDFVRSFWQTTENERALFCTDGGKMPVFKDTIKTAEWESGTIKVTINADEGTTLQDAKPTNSIAGFPYTNYTRLIDPDDPATKTLFPLVAPPLIEHDISSEMEVTADRVAGYFSNDMTLGAYKCSNEDSTNEYEIATSNTPTLVVRKNSGGTLSTITGFISGTGASINKNVCFYRYSYAYYMKLTDYADGYYYRRGTVGSKINNINDIIKSVSTQFTSSCMATFETNFLIFENQTDCDYYLQTGDSSKAVKFETELPTVKRWYIKSKIYKCDDNLKTNKTLVQQNDSNYDFDKTLSGYAGTRPIAGYIDQSNDNEYNIIMVKNPNSNFVEGSEKLGNAEPIEEIKEFNEMSNDVWSWSVPFPYNNRYYYGSNNTNIPIFANINMVYAYFNGLIDENSSLNKGGNYEGRDVDLGEPKDKTTFNSASSIGLFDTVYSCTTALQCKAVRDIIYDETNMDNILDGLKLNGETPLSFIIDSFEIPFDVSPWCEELTATALSLGTYVAQLETPINVLAQRSTVVDMFSVDISGIYNDFRDYLQRFYLKLPYYSLIELDINQYLYHTLSCKVHFSYKTGDIRYYLLCDGIVTDTYDTSVRIGVPLIGTDNYTASMQKINASMGIVNTGVSALAHGMTFNVSGAINDVQKGFNYGMELDKATPKMQQGSYSNTAQWAEEMKAYLIIEQPQIEYGDNIEEQYGRPDNRYGVIGDNTGFITCSNALLTGKATEHEKEMIIALLQKGIYI